MDSDEESASDKGAKALAHKKRVKESDEESASDEGAKAPAHKKRVKDSDEESASDGGASAPASKKRAMESATAPMSPIENIHGDPALQQLFGSGDETNAGAEAATRASALVSKDNQGSSQSMQIHGRVTFRED